MSSDAGKLQAQVRANSAELASYLQDLHSWEKDIKQKEQSLQAGKISLTKQPATAKPTSSAASAAPIRSSQPPVAAPSSASSDQHRFGVHKERGNALYAAADYRAAIAEYNQCAVLLPLDPLPLSNRAQCSLKLAQWAEADRDCSAALELDGSNVKALYRRATARKGLGKADQAAADIDRVLAIEPGNKPALQLRRELQDARKAAPGGGGRGSGAGSAAAGKAAEQPRRKLVIEEEADDEDDEDEEEVFSVQRAATVSRPSAAREEKEQSSAIARGQRTHITRMEEESKAASSTTAAGAGPAVMDISTTPKAAPSPPASVATGPASSALASPTVSSPQPPSVAALSTPAPTASSSTPPASSSAATLGLRAPRSALDFDSQYRRVRQQPAHLAVLLQLIPTADYPSILRTALDSSLLSSIISAVNTMHTSVLSAGTHTT